MGALYLITDRFSYTTPWETIGADTAATLLIKAEKFYYGNGIMSLKVHQELSILGSAPDLEEFVKTVSGLLGAEWEEPKADRRDSFDYIVFRRNAVDQVPPASIFFSKKPGALELANIVPESSQALTVDAYNLLAETFAAVARPVAKEMGLQLDESGPYSELSRWLSERAVNSLRSFSALANKSTGSGHPLDFKRWATFIVYCNRDGRQIPLHILEQYLVEEEGWEYERAYDLELQYEFGLRLLERNSQI